MTALVALALLAAASPVSLSLSPVTGGTADAPVLDGLLATASTELERDGVLRVAPAETADVLVAPSLVPLPTGKVRLVLELKSRTAPARGDRVGFEVTPGKFGPQGAKLMLKAAAERAADVRARAETPPPPPPPPTPVAAANEPAPAPDAPAVKTDPGRIRFGISAGAGAFFPGPMFAFGAEARIGWQFTTRRGETDPT
jgi:hypothetical protein